MAKTFLKSVQNAIKFWWIPLFVGLLLIATGIYSMTVPVASFVALAAVFSVSFLISGFFEIIFSISNKDRIDNWGWTLVYGISTFVIGLFLIINPIETFLVFAFYVGFLFLFRSISGISYAIDLKNYGVTDWKWLMFISILGLASAFILIAYPKLAGLTAVYWMSFTIISSGFFAVYVSFQLKKLKNISNQYSAE